MVPPAGTQRWCSVVRWASAHPGVGSPDPSEAPTRTDDSGVWTPDGHDPTATRTRGDDPGAVLLRRTTRTSIAAAGTATIKQPAHRRQPRPSPIPSPAHLAPPATTPTPLLGGSHEPSGRHSTGTVSLNFDRIGRRPRISTRQMLAWSRWQFHEMPMSTPSAHATDDFIGDTWLTTSTFW